MSKILVIGDSGIDVFQYGEIKRISPEAPVPVFNPTYKVENYGMASNVYENLKSLGCEKVEIITNEIKPLKTRFVDVVSNQQIMRLDKNDIIKPINKKIIISTDLDGVIISDYDKGFLKKEDIIYIGELCKKNNIPSFLDSKKKLNFNEIDFLNNIDFIKINNNEYNQSNLELYRGELIVTLGSMGAKHINSNILYPIENKSEVRDLSGAGDTFLAGLVVKYLESKDLSEAIKYANRCASYVVTQKGVVNWIEKNKI